MFHSFNPHEVMAAAPDALAMALGVSVSRPHPFAGMLTLREIAYAAGIAKRPDLAGRSDMEVMGMGLSVGDFSKTLAEAVQQLTVRTFLAQAQHTKFCEVVEVKNFHAADLPNLDADVDLEALAHDAEITRGFAITAAGASSAQLTTYAKIIGLSRRAIVNDQLDGFARVIAGLGASAARLEARLVADALVANPTLDDGAVVFHADHNNVLADALSFTSLGQAMALLRTQTNAAGNRLDLAARHLVVSAEQEFAARQNVLDAGLNVEVAVLSYLPTGHWYLLADTKIHPAVGTLKLKGTTSAVRVVEQRRRPDNIDGSAVKVVADLGAIVMSRTGIVRGGV